MKTIRETEYTKMIVLDEPEENKSCGEYRIQYRNQLGHLIFDAVKFQKGPIQENGVNGCQIEDLLAICIHRLEGFQSGDLQCDYNQNALIGLRDALEQLEDRTIDRKVRGVEGIKQR